MKMLYVNCGVKNYLKKYHAVIYATFAVAKRKPEKNSALYRRCTCSRGKGFESRTSLNVLSGFLFTSALVAYTTAMIFLQITLFLVTCQIDCRFLFTCMYSFRASDEGHQANRPFKRASDASPLDAVI